LVNKWFNNCFITCSVKKSFGYSFLNQFMSSYYL